MLSFSRDTIKKNEQQLCLVQPPDTSSFRSSNPPFDEISHVVTQRSNHIMRGRIVDRRSDGILSSVLSECHANLVSAGRRFAPVGLRSVSREIVSKEGDLGLKKNVTVVFRAMSIARVSVRVVWSECGEEESDAIEFEHPARLTDPCRGDTHAMLLRWIVIGEKSKDTFEHFSEILPMKSVASSSRQSEDYFKCGSQMIVRHFNCIAIDGCFLDERTEENETRQQSASEAMDVPFVSIES